MQNVFLGSDQKRPHIMYFIVFSASEIVLRNDEANVCCSKPCRRPEYGSHASSYSMACRYNYHSNLRPICGSPRRQ